MSNLVRCFVALRVSSAVTRRLEREIGFFQLAGADVKWVPGDNFHLTVSYLGDLEPEALIDTEEQLEEAAHGVSKINPSVRGILALPDIDQPRVIAAGLEGDMEPLEDLARDLKTRFRRIGVRPDKKGFKPHVTIGRVRGDRNLDELQKRLAKSLKRSFGVLNARELILFMSDEGPRGPIYTPLKSVDLANTK